MADRGIEFWDEDEFSRIRARWQEAVRKRISDALRVVQNGGTPSSGAKRLQGFAVPLWELKHRSGARVVYTLAFVDDTGCVHVIDAFSKDASKDGKMRTSDKTRIEQRIGALQARVRAARRHLH